MQIVMHFDQAFLGGVIAQLGTRLQKAWPCLGHSLCMRAHDCIPYHISAQTPMLICGMVCNHEHTIPHIRPDTYAATHRCLTNYNFTIYTCVVYVLTFSY